jgi:ABC-type transporter Mla subunit MlaD
MNPSHHSPQQRQTMIAEAAYFRAEHRGFQGGDAVQDWLEAEVEIDRMLEGSEPVKRSLADQLAQQLRDWDNDLARLRAKARNVSAELLADIERELERLKPVRASADKALEEMRQRGGRARDDLRSLVDKARSELSETLERLANRLR